MHGYPARRGRPPVPAERLYDLPDDGYRYELVRGRLVREPLPGGLHSGIGVRLIGALLEFSRRQAGFVFGPDCGFLLERDPDTVLGPDVSFVRAERLPGGLPRGHVPFAPDLAVEILSASNRRVAITRKAHAYRAAGAEQVWIVDPEGRTLAVHDAHGVRVLLGEDVLVGDGVVAGFRLELRVLFA